MLGATGAAQSGVRALTCSLGILLLGVLRVAAQGPAKHPVRLEDLANLNSAEDLQLSPAGNMLAYVVHEELWSVATRQGSRPQQVGKGVLPVWSPDGRRLAYYSSESGALQLWVRDIESGHAEQLTYLEGGVNPDPETRLLGWTRDPLSYHWSPDGTKLVFASRVLLRRDSAQSAAHPVDSASLDPQPGAPLVLTNDTPPEWTLSGIFRSGGFGAPAFASNGRIDFSTKAASTPPMANELFIVDTHTKAIQPLTTDGAIYFNPDWSPDGRTIVCASSEGHSLLAYGTGTTNLYAIDISTGKKRAITHGTGDKRMPSWSPDGKWVAYLGGAHFDIQSVFVVPSTGGQATNLTSALDRDVLQFVWDHDSQSILLTLQDGVSWPIERVNIQTRHVDPIGGDGAALRTDLTAARSGDIAWQESNGSADGLIRLLRRRSDAPITLVELNPQLSDWDLGPQEVVRWRNSRGEDIEGVLIKPAGYKEGHRYPLIVDAYPGQANGFKAYAMTGNQAWASRGYAIFWPTTRAPHVWMNPFKSRDYALVAKGPRGWDVMVDDVMSGINELVRRGVVDPDRIGVYGFSNGGAVVNQLVTRTDRFKCAVSVAGALSADWSRAFFLHTMAPLVPIVAGALPWQEPQTYVALSAVYRLDRVTTPMLLADGDDDGDFLLNTIEMYNGLRYLGRKVSLLRYPNQGHGFEGAALKDFWQRESTFLDECLKPEKPST